MPGFHAIQVEKEQKDASFSELMNTYRAFCGCFLGQLDV